MTYVDIRFLWLPLSTMKWSGVHFTHIYEWKRGSPSSGSYGSYSWTFLVDMVTLGFASMVYFTLFGYERESKPTFESEAFILANNDYLE
jgi:hypothetical protein